MSETVAGSPAPSPDEPKAASQLQFHFVTSPLFRSVPADGAWFNPDMSGMIHITFFNEHAPIPDKIVVNLDERGLFKSEAFRVSKEGIVRELEVDVVMNFADAAQFHATLGDNLRQMQTAISQAIPDEAKDVMKKAMNR